MHGSEKWHLWELPKHNKQWSSVYSTVLSAPGFFPTLRKTLEHWTECRALKFMCVLETTLFCSKTVLSTVNHCLLLYSMIVWQVRTEYLHRTAHPSTVLTMCLLCTDGVTHQYWIPSTTLMVSLHRTDGFLLRTKYPPPYCLPSTVMHIVFTRWFKMLQGKFWRFFGGQLSD